MSKLSKYYWVGFFLLIFVLFLGTIRATKPRILILSSYSKDNLIAQYVLRGTDDAIAGNRIPVSILSHYMGTNAVLNSEQVTRKGNEALSFINHFDPNILIAVGLDANKLLSTKYSELKPSMWIVPVAVDSAFEDMGYPKNANVIGVMRQMPYLGIGDFVSELVDRPKITLSIIGADTISNQVRVKKFLLDRPKNIEVTSTLLSNCFDVWQKHIQQLSGKSDALLVMPTQNLQENCGPSASILAGDKFIPWIESNSIPLPIGMDGGYVKNGGAVSFYPSYQEEGELAMGLAFSLIEARGKEKLQPIYTDSYQIALSTDRLNKRKLPISNVYLQYGKKSGLNYRDSD